jgi:hypothetical protein
MTVAAVPAPIKTGRISSRKLFSPGAVRIRLEYYKIYREEVR